MFRDDSKDTGIISASQIVDVMIELGRKSQISFDAIAHEVARRQAKPLSAVSNADAEAVFENWRPLFKEYFGLTPDFSKIIIPQLASDAQDHTRIILMPEELARNEKPGLHNWLFNVCTELFPAWRYYKDLDKDVVHSDLHPKDGSYAIRVRDLIEADEEFSNLSAEQIWKMKRKTETLAERLMHELKVWHESKHHLDLKSITLCAGSRNSDGDVPFVYWRLDRLGVCYCYPDFHNDSLRARAVVS